MPQRRGFALQSPERMAEIASAGGQAAHRGGHAHQFTASQARAAGKRAQEVLQAPWWTDSAGRIELRIIQTDATACSHAGSCDAEVLALSRQGYIARQLRRLDPRDVRAALRPFGAWTEFELRDHAQNLQRLLWIACGDIHEGGITCLR